MPITSLAEKLKSLQSADLTGTEMIVDWRRQSVILTFSFDGYENGERHDVTLHLAEIYVFHFAGDPKENGQSVLDTLHIEEWTSNQLTALSRISPHYRMAPEGSSPIGGPIYHLTITGVVSLEVAFGSYSVFEQVL